VNRTGSFCPRLSVAAQQHLEFAASPQVVLHPDRPAMRFQYCYHNEQNIIIMDYYYTHQYISAAYAAGDKSIWLGYGFFMGKDASGPEAVLGHEFMHAITGLDDDALAQKLGITLRGGSTSELSKWFHDNCLPKTP
jgi:hypothetical protein